MLLLNNVFSAIIALTITAPISNTNTIITIEEIEIHKLTSNKNNNLIEYVNSVKYFHKNINDINDKIDKIETSYYDIDLRAVDAQESSARASWWMVILTIISTMITLLTLYTIFRTLLYTKKAVEQTAEMVEEAKKTTKAADRTAEEAASTTLAAHEANKLIKSDQRPWISVNIALVQSPDPNIPILCVRREHQVIWASFGVEFSNYGKSPAFDVAVAVELEAHYRDTKGDMAELNRKAISKATEDCQRRSLTNMVFPNQPGQTRHVNGNLRLKDIDPDEDRKFSIHFSLAICYRFDGAYGGGITNGVIYLRKESPPFLYSVQEIVAFGKGAYLPGYLPPMYW